MTPAPDLPPSDVTDPAWYVTNGQRVVGPVAMDLLLRGVSRGRVPEHCFVARAGWSDWRPMDQIRELAHWRRSATGHQAFGARDSDVHTLLSCARDRGDVLTLALQAAVATTGAARGLVHRRRLPYVGLVASAALGDGAVARLGDVLRRDDSAFIAAHAGEPLLGRSHPTPLGRTQAARLVGPEGMPCGVALMPVLGAGRAVDAIIELGHDEHEFRAGDEWALRRLQRAVEARLRRLDSLH